MERKRECNKAGGGREFPMCCSCDGRIHLPGCTTKRNRNRDCCLARHKMLHDAGQTRGIYDGSLEMWTPEMKEWNG